MANNFPFPSSYPFRVPSRGEIEGGRRLQEADRAFKNQNPGPMPDRDNWIGATDAFMRGMADEFMYGFADEMAASLSSGSVGGYTPNLYGNYEEHLKRQRAIDQDDEKHRYAYRKAGQILAKYLKPNRMIDDALYGFGSGEGGLANRSDSAIREASEGILWDHVGEAVSKPAKVGWKHVRNRMDLDSSPVGKRISGKIEEWAPAARDVFLDIAKDQVRSWQDSFDSREEAAPEPPAATSKSGRLTLGLPRGAENRGSISEDVGTLQPNHDALVSRSGPKQSNSGIALRVPQRAAFAKAAPRQAPADWTKRILGEIVVGAPPPYASQNRTWGRSG